MRFTFILALVVFLPATAFAQGVAVLPVSYWLVWEDVRSSAKETAILEEVRRAVEESGYRAVTGTAVNNAARIASGSKATDCRDRQCLVQVADHLELENALFVAVAEEGLLYNVEINLAKGEQEYGPIGGNFSKLRIGVHSMVKSALAPMARPEEPARGQGAGQTVPVDERQGAVDKKKPLGPTPFIATAAVTGALGVTWVVLEAVGYSKQKKYEAGEIQWNQDSASNLQTASRVFLGLTLAGVVTTTVLGFLTDFHQKSDGPIEALAPAPVDRGGVLVLKGRF